MDFSLTEDQEALRDLAAQIFGGHASARRVQEVESTADRFDRELWAELARANLLGIALPERYGGSGLGILELCLLLEQQGRAVAPVPLLATLVSSAATIAEHASAGVQERWLPGVVSGKTVMTAALAEAGANDVFGTSVNATPDGGSWRLDGTKVAVPAAHLASAVLVPARAEQGLGVFLVDRAAPGVSSEIYETTDRELQSTLVFEGTPVPADHVVGDLRRGRAILERALERTLVGLCALQVGVTEEALRLAASYTSQRQQFGRPLATNQGVALRAADAYVDVEAIRATMWQAAWRLATGRDASEEVIVAKWWASDAGDRVVHSTQHLHGGLGADVDYPVHRYFLWGKQIEVTLGGASQQLARLGDAVAESAKRGAAPGSRAGAGG